ncbi:acyl carrier protein [Oceanivirga miroungae]|uniref:Acyl carrier protein n=1 Tax=Oceanivirga miroungae TaxID=1130046 RepID=A0A6I8M5V5_9FUSO|nr:acyl carrier protein [Oceanivirga miroungae]VWL84772.1 acyl carrier protein [Oceanivirga miroungae]
MLEEIKEIILEQLDVNEEELNENSRIVDDLGADSLDVVEILNAIENKYDIEILKEDVVKLHTIKEIKEYVERRKNDK